MKAREVVANYLLEQVLGPTENSLFKGKPMPEALADGKVHLRKEDVNSQFHDPDTGFPLLQNTRPEMIFGTGVLHSPTLQGNPQDDLEDYDNSLEEVPFGAIDTGDTKAEVADDPNEESSDIDKTQMSRPSAMGLTSQIIALPASRLAFTVSGATYETVPVEIEGLGSRSWYRRMFHSVVIEKSWIELSKSPHTLTSFPIPGVLGEYAALQLRWRPTSATNSQGNQLIALTAVVSHSGKKPDDVFQFELKVALSGGGGFASPDKTKSLSRDDLEEQEVEFQYRHVNSYANGHGISVSWEEDQAGEVLEVRTTSVPIFYQEQISTSLDGTNIKMMDMYEQSPNEIRDSLQSMVSSYGEWISENRLHSTGLPKHQKEIGERLCNKAENIFNRMQRGLDTLFASGNDNILLAFRLANKAMHLQQEHGKIPRRNFKDVKGQRIVFDEPLLPENGTFGSWRPFQIAFLLMTLPGLLDPHDAEREDVDLIFFPTGGGKTEAYLAAAALVIVHRRLENSNHSGVDVLMRYTLRLLTVQQFERSSGLIVALEHLRRLQPHLLGEAPISIGVWLGDKTTPNKRTKAIQILEGKGGKDEETHPFVLSKCPWCGAAFALRATPPKNWVGYKKSSEKPYTLRFICGDESCEFSRESTGLPIWITDEDVYEFKPSFVLGTVDKFAQISWEPNSRALFNIGADGKRIGLPPNLIIQDELHLISGPLGSMVGLYEAVINELCSNEVDGVKTLPKIIASTATTRRYEAQIEALYGRSRVTLFPQAISRANETFFSSVKKVDGVPTKGTMYLGINPATYQTGQLASSQISAFLSQAPSAWDGPESEINYYSTSVWFFNSLKELGQTLTLMQSTVISLLNSMWRDRRLPNQKTRYLEPFKELTGRVSSAQVSSALAELAIPSDRPESIHTCLASSIMEVGVDISRLGLLTINSQPKLTAQYIQVSGRVGRDPLGPGLVVMLYNSGRARDRSVYEHFGDYHRKLYAQVEPLSVTPFAIQAMRKGLWGAIIGMYRMLISADKTPESLDEEAFSRAVSVLRERVTILNSSTTRIEDFEFQVSELKAKWESYKPLNWKYDSNQEMGSADNPSTALLRRRSEQMSHIYGDSSINIPQSMRTVDGQTDLLPAANAYSFDLKRMSE